MSLPNRNPDRDERLAANCDTFSRQDRFRGGYQKERCEDSEPCANPAIFLRYFSSLRINGEKATGGEKMRILPAYEIGERRVREEDELVRVLLTEAVEQGFKDDLEVEQE